MSIFFVRCFDCCCRRANDFSIKNKAFIQRENIPIVHSIIMYALSFQRDWMTVRCLSSTADRCVVTDSLSFFVCLLLLLLPPGPSNSKPSFECHLNGLNCYASLDWLQLIEMTVISDRCVRVSIYVYDDLPPFLFFAFFVSINRIICVFVCA